MTIALHNMILYEITYQSKWSRIAFYSILYVTLSSFLFSLPIHKHFRVLYSYGNRLCSSQRVCVCVWLTEKVQLIDFMCSLMLWVNFWHLLPEHSHFRFYFSVAERHSLKAKKTTVFFYHNRRVKRTVFSLFSIWFDWIMYGWCFKVLWLLLLSLLGFFGFWFWFRFWYTKHIQFYS